MPATALIPPQSRAAAFKRRILTFRLQRWFLSFGLKLRRQLVPALRYKECAAEE